MPELTIVANIIAKADKTQLVKAELERLVDMTRAEQGCLQYDLHQDNVNPAHFLFFERWASRELWQAHMVAPHVQAFGAASEGAIDSFSVNEMSCLT